MECGCRRDRASNVMRCHKDIVGFGPRSEFLCLQEATKVRDIRLDDVCRLQLKEFTVVVARMNALSRCYWNSNLL